MDIAIAIAIGGVILWLAVKLKQRKSYMNALSRRVTEPLASTDNRERPSAVGSAPAVHGELVTVFETDDAAELLVAKSLLEAGNVPYFAKGELAQDFVGTGLVGVSYLTIEPVALQVPKEMAEKARALLENEDEP